MNALTAFSGRNTKEMLRDPLNLAFGLGFPVVLLLLLTAIQRNIPVSLFQLEYLTPGIAIFGLSFISLFSATLISKDRTTSFLMRLFASPMRPVDYILGYTLPLIPMALAQAILCYLVAGLLGMKLTLNVLLAVVVTLPRRALLHRHRAALRQRAERQTGGRHLRGALDQRFRVAERNVV